MRARAHTHTHIHTHTILAFNYYQNYFDTQERLVHLFLL